MRNETIKNDTAPSFDATGRNLIKTFYFLSLSLARFFADVTKCGQFHFIPVINSLQADLSCSWFREEMTRTEEPYSNVKRALDGCRANEVNVAY